MKKYIIAIIVTALVFSGGAIEFFIINIGSRNVFNETKEVSKNIEQVNTTQVSENKWILDTPLNGYDILEDLLHVNASFCRGQWSALQVRILVESYTDFLNLSRNEKIFFSQDLEVNYLYAKPIICLRDTWLLDPPGNDVLRYPQEIAGKFNFIFSTILWENTAQHWGVCDSERVEVYLDRKSYVNYTKNIPEICSFTLNTFDYNLGYHNMEVRFYRYGKVFETCYDSFKFVELPKNCPTKYWFKNGLNETTVDDNIAFLISQDMIMYIYKNNFIVYGNRVDEINKEYILTENKYPQ